MTRPIYASGLLKTASLLAGVGAGAGRPALADLRRATSTAYYALFHQIVRHGALDFMPAASEEEIAEIARWFTHTGILEASNIVDEAADPKPLEQVKKAYRSGVMAVRSSCGGSASSELILVADAFRSLQLARHSADYDGNYDPVRAVTINHVDDAEAAVRTTWAMWHAGDSTDTSRHGMYRGYACFLRLALLKSGGPRTR